MFNGIINNKARIINIVHNSNSIILEVTSNLKLKKSDLGASLSCNGVCLTVSKITNKSFFFYLSNETLKRTTFKKVKKGDILNIEKSLVLGQTISGHYVQGHVDTTGLILTKIISDKTWILKVKIHKNFNKYLIEKASISVNGVSLTINKIFKNGFIIHIIPHTLKLTNLIHLKKGNLINIEFDIFGKYLLKFKN